MPTRRIAALEAQLQGRDLPEAQVPTMALSPPRKASLWGARIRHQAALEILCLCCNKLALVSDVEYSF